MEMEELVKAIADELERRQRVRELAQALQDKELRRQTIRTNVVYIGGHIVAVMAIFLFMHWMEWI